MATSTGSHEKVLKTLLAGGVAGCCAKSTTAPFDRVKILLQAHHIRYTHLGIFPTAKIILEREGARGLFKGNGAQMVRIFPYAAIQFASYEHYKVWLRERYGNGQLTRLATGSLAGMTAVMLTYPLDVVRARLAFQVSGEALYATGIVDALRVMLTREGGIRGLYRGIVPTMIGMAPYAGLSFYCFDTLKMTLLERWPGIFGMPCPNRDGQLVLIVPAKLLCGGIAGAFAQTIAYPLDVARRKMQLSLMQPNGPAHSSWMGTLQHAVEQHGLRRGLYRGLAVNYIKVTPMVAVSFSVYELMKQTLGMDVHHETAKKS